MGERKPTVPSGPFSAGSVFESSAKVGKAYPRPWAPSKRPSSAPTSKVKVEEDQGPVRAGRRRGDFSDIIDTTVDVKPEDGGYISSDPDEEGEGARKDVDFINLISDDEQDASGGVARLNSPALVPVRIQRVEHRDRAPAVNPEPSSAAVKIKQQDSDDEGIEAIPAKPSRKGKRRAKDAEATPSQRLWRGVYEDDSDILIDDSHTSPQPPPGSIPSSPKASRSPEKTKRNARVSEPIFQTEEGHQEHERRQKQLAVLLDELGGVNLDEGGEERWDQKADRVYIFQFPSKLPDLLAPVVKEEPSSPPPALPAGPASAPNSASAPIKIEEDAPPQNPLSRASTFAGRPAHRPSLAPGLMGKLRIHKSGKATLDWGGTSLLVSKGLDESMLQDVVVVRPLEDKQNGEGAAGDSSAAVDVGSGARRGGTDAVEGEALAFGQVRGKFVVTPDWDQIWG